MITSGEPYLKTQQHTLASWQLSLLDVKAFLFLVAIAIVSVEVLCCSNIVLLLQAGCRNVRHVKVSSRSAKGKTA